MQERNRMQRALRCCDLIFLRILPTAILLVLTVRNVMAWISFSGTAGVFFLRQLYNDTFPLVCLFLGLSSAADFWERTPRAAAVFRYLSAGTALLHVVLAGVNIAVYAPMVTSPDNIEPILCAVACIPIAVSCVLWDKSPKVGMILGAIATLLLLIAGVLLPLGEAVVNEIISLRYFTASLRYALNTLIIGFCFLAPVFTGLVHRSKE